MNACTRNKWLTQYKRKLKIPGSTPPTIPGFDCACPMTYTEAYSKENVRAVRGPYGFFEAPSPGRFSSPYTKTPRPVFLGEAIVGETEFTTSWSFISKFILIGVVSAVLTDLILRMIWKKER